jgi:thymidylate synthase (FAD)
VGAKLLWITPDAEKSIAYMARVSNPTNQENPDIARLIKYMIDHSHWSPFEMVSACFEINTTRDIARQILRHRSFSFQEFSQRYADPTQSLGYSTRSARLQDPKNRQASLPSDEGLQKEWQTRQQRIIGMVEENYAWAIAQGMAKESARVILPEGLTNSRMYMTGTLRSWMHYIQIRSNVGTQIEHRLIACAIWDALDKAMPIVFEAFNQHVREIDDDIE